MLNRKTKRGLKNRNKAQVSAEFIGVIMIMFFIFIIFTTIILGRITEYRKQRNWNTLVETADVLQDEVDLASTMIDGYSRKFWLPNTIELKNYSVSIHTGNGNTSNQSFFQIQYIPLSEGL